MSREILREPLVHFAALGAVLFCLYALAGPDPAAPRMAAPVATAADTVIVLDEVIATRLARQFEAVWNRPPTDDEMDGLLDAFVTEEILVREALALGLDADDAVVRQRLRQKMDFLLEAGASGAEPTDADLQAWLERNADSFAMPPRVSFSQVFLGEAPADAEVAAAREALALGARPDQIGERSLLPARLPASPPQAVDGTFGTGMFDAVTELPQGTWAGPVESGYGRHLVRVDSFAPGRLPPLDEIRAEVAQAWQAAEATRARKERLRQLREIYTVERLLPEGEGP